MISENLEELVELDTLEMEGLLCEKGRERRVTLKNDIATNMNMETISWRQKVREK